VDALFDRFTGGGRVRVVLLLGAGFGQLLTGHGNVPWQRPELSRYHFSRPWTVSLGEGDRVEWPDDGCRAER
jgi:hypothetical protein